VNQHIGGVRIKRIVFGVCGDLGTEIVGVGLCSVDTSHCGGNDGGKHFALATAQG
jgi:hypothetical protein